MAITCDIRTNSRQQNNRPTLYQYENIFDITYRLRSILFIYGIQNRIHGERISVRECFKSEPMFLDVPKYFP